MIPTTKKKRSLCNMIEVPTIATIAIILQYNNVVHLKFALLYVKYISKKIARQSKEAGKCD